MPWKEEVIVTDEYEDLVRVRYSVEKAILVTYPHDATEETRQKIRNASSERLRQLALATIRREVKEP